MDFAINCIAGFIVIFIVGAVASLAGEVIFRTFRWIDKRLHPEQCPLCKMDIEHLDTCLGCPFVVVDEWPDDDFDCGNLVLPSVFHCGLKDKKYIQELKDKQAKKLIEKL